MKKLSTLLLLSGFCFILNAQVNSVPGGPFNWTSAAAWVGGVPPTAGQVANIVSGSTVNLDVPVVHSADINILAGGVLTSPTPFNDLTINNANLTNDGQINFVIINAAPITINNGHYFGSNTSLMQSGNFYVLFTALGPSSNNYGDFIVYGNMTIDGAETFDNFVYIGVFGTTNINANCTMNNMGTLSSTDIANNGNLDNSGSVSSSAGVVNSISGSISGNGNYFSIGTNLDNLGTIAMTDSMAVAGDLNNSGSFSNDTGTVNIAGNFYNDGLLTGSGNGQFDIALNTANAPTGVINGDIDVCDATLVPTTYFDSDSGAVDFLTVTFCTVSYASVESISANSLFNIYPNPSNGIYNLSNLENSSLNIFSREGKIIFNQQIFNANVQIDLTQFPIGIYFMQVVKGDNIYYTKLIKQ